MDAKKKFTLGDRVKINNKESQKRYRGKVGTITVTDRIRRGFSINWDYEVYFDDKMLPNYIFSIKEMDREFTKGEQLLFPFMDEVI